MKKAFNTIAFMLFTFMLVSCNPNNKIEKIESSTVSSVNEIIPDSVVRFLIMSASSDFKNHQPPTPTDFRNVKIGYFASDKTENIYLLCGEFLSKEDKKWVEFTTIKTSGYEQYLGKTQYCQDAIMVLTDENLTRELKIKFNE
ncbi:MAG: hypothetical protein IPP46_13455 [Bacteroidetes bacterium]|nr:hypothetical protein [Bacteroidota bacterium]